MGKITVYRLLAVGKIKLNKMKKHGEIRFRTYGDSGPLVYVLHGGPAAVGTAAPIARGLAGTFRVIEPWQRGSGDIPLTVAAHVNDLYELIISLSDIPRPAIVGESWGAMLALAFAAEHPENAGPLALVSCGTFDKTARARLVEILDERVNAELRRKLDRVPDEFPDPDEQMARKYELMHPLYTYESDVPCEDWSYGEPLDIRAHTETWENMVKLQEEGIYPRAFSAIRSPVLMLHGANDPHPGRMIRDSLTPHIPQLEYVEFDKCGHYPWSEKYARHEFFKTLNQWLTDGFNRL